eukprot:Em0011g1160a
MSNDARISFASSNDNRHPPDCILDRNPDTFWITTGLFPQEFIVTFARKIVAKDISIKSTGVRRLQIEASNEDDHLGNFKLVVTKDLNANEGLLQCETFKLDNVLTVKHLKFVISQAYSHFVSVHDVEVEGKTAT